MGKKGIVIPNMPNILWDFDLKNTRYTGYKGRYASAICPICHELFYYNQKYYSEEQPPATCGRYNCLKRMFSHG